MSNPRRPLFFTFSDGDFSPRALAMIKSLIEFDSEAEVIFFHFDDLTSAQKGVFEHFCTEVLSVKEYLGERLYGSLESSRLTIELLWTLPSVLAQAILLKITESEYSDLVYLDADLFFFSSPNIIWSEVPWGSIAIVEHNFPERLKLIFPNSGKFNVSWVSFPNNSIGLECASDWATKCIEACPSSPVVIRGKVVYGDQLYLEDWPSTFQPSLHVITNVGAGVAPWNYENYKISNSLPIQINESPLIFYHFSSHQFGFILARKMGTLYSAVSPIPAKIYSLYENSLRENAIQLGKLNWKSRYQPAHLRLIQHLSRSFKGVKSFVMINHFKNPRL